MSTLVTPLTATTTWNLDPVHSVAEFKVKHMMISNVKGQFATLTGVLTLDEADITNSRVEASIEAASISTRDAQRDTHLKSEDFFHVEKFPRLSFKSTRITRTGKGELAVAGDLTIRGVTRNVVFIVEGPTAPAKDPLGQYTLGALGDHQDQPQRLRPDVERYARGRQPSRRRRSDHYARRSVCEGLNHLAHGAHRKCCAPQKGERLCHSAQSSRLFKRSPRLRALA